MFALQRALVKQRQELAVTETALADFRFGFDPLMATLDRFPFSLVEVESGGTETRTFSGVRWRALETLRISVTKDTVSEITAVIAALATLAGLPWRPSVSRSSSTYVPCRIWNAELVGQPSLKVSAGAVAGARDIVLRWEGVASWENIS